uniref:Uncharacterized protein n=1 Tax=uncultured marine virus TaxID=186617 RepID=A0A0F7L8H7_9VIRU|nr:hypothetical protein [uncultured marine virus]
MHLLHLCFLLHLLGALDESFGLDTESSCTTLKVVFNINKLSDSFWSYDLSSTGKE